jgi:hypothetical protein
MTDLITGDTWGDEVESVRAHILKQAAQPFGVLLPELAASRAELLSAIDGVTDEQAEFRPGTGEGEEAWGIAEVLRHFASIETIMAERIRLLGAGDSVESLTPTYPGYMESVETRRLPELIGAVDASHAALLAAIAEIEGHERLDAVAAHRRFGELNCRGWIVMHGLHLRDHARQIERIKALDGFPTA